MLSHVRAALGVSTRVIPCRGWTEVERAVRTVAVDVAVLSPDVEGSGATSIQRLRHRYPSLPILLYLPISGPAMRLAVDLARDGVTHVVLQNYDDQPARLRERLEVLGAYDIGERAVGMLAASLAAAPAGILRAVAQLFMAPHVMRGVESVARQAGLSRRTFDRHLAAAGVASARHLLLAARLARAYHYARDPGYTLRDVATKLRYSDVRLFTRHIRAATGMTAAAWRASLTSDALFAQLRRLMFRQGAWSLDDEDDDEG
jgi:AraC-like DNA-binding protein